MIERKERDRSLGCMNSTSFSASIRVGEVRAGSIEQNCSI